MKKICLSLSILFSFILLFTGCTIKKTPITGIEFNDSTVVYNGESHSLSIEGTLPEGVEVSYSGNEYVNAGEYTITAEFSDSTGKYQLPDPMTATLTINPAEITGITMGGATVTYNGSSHSLEIEGVLPSGVTVSYTNNNQTAVGTYEVTATFTDSTGNYVVPSPITATLVIEEPEHVHNYGEVSYVWSQDNTSVTATRVCSKDATHIETETVATASEVTQQHSCTLPEMTTYTATFTNPAFAAQVKAVETKAASHSLTHVAAVDATCTEEGNVEYWLCSTCNTKYADENTTSVLVDVVVPALGHNYGEVTYTWSEDNSSVTATRVCSKDATHIETETVATTAVITQNQTCVLPELTTYTAVFVNAAFEVQTKANVQTKAEAGHTEEAIPAVEATCTTAGSTAGVKCSVCNEILVAPTTIPAKGHTAGEPVQEKVVPATCTEDGSYDLVVYCSACREELSRETVTVDALGHDEVSHEAKAPTCTEKGWHEYVTCSRCDYTTYEEIPATGHTEVEIPAVPATCTTAGSTEGKHCSVCNEILVAQEEVAAKGHTHESVYTKPTFDADGYTTYTCHCGDSYVVVDEGSQLEVGAVVGGERYESLKDAVAAAPAGSIVVLVKDLVEETAIEVTKDITIDLDGHTITIPEDTAGDGVFHVTSGTLTINGEGIVNGTGNNGYNMAIFAEGPNSKVIINGGTYTNMDVDVSKWGDNTHFDLIYVKNGAQAEINGGTFECITPKWTLNHRNDSQGKITVNGGSFLGFDPSNDQTDDLAESTVVVEGKCAQLNGEGYYVVAAHVYKEVYTKPTVEADGYTTYTCTCGHSYVVVDKGTQLVVGVIVNGVKYETLTEAVAASPAGSTVVLFKDLVEETAIEITKDITIELNGHIITIPEDTAGDGVFHVTSGTLIINGEGIVNGTGNNGYNMAIFAEGPNSKVIINGGTYTNMDVDVSKWGDNTHFDLIYVKNGAQAEINGGTFECITPKWTLNHRNDSQGKITVNGGSFLGFDPSNDQTDDLADSTVVVEGKCAQLNSEGYYVVAAHVYTSVVTKPTCTEKGYTTHTCTCGHSYTDAEVAALDHDYKVSEHVDATCTVDGHTTYVCKNDATHTYTDTIKAEGHTEEEIPAVEATCTTDGSTAGVKCSVCDEIITAPTTVPATGHINLTHHVAVAPTAEETGNIEYWSCSCGALFLDAEGQHPTTLKEVTLARLVGITIKTQPTKVEYLEGEHFDPTGIEVILNSEDGTTEVVPNDKLMISASEALTVGTTSIKVEYLDFEAYVEITVVVSNETLAAAYVQTALAYYYQQAEIQYDQRINRRVVGAAPEMATSQYTLYLDCSSFIASSFINAFGQKPLGITTMSTKYFEAYAKETWEANGNQASETVLFYVNTQDYTTAESKAAILEEVRAALQPGDLINYRHGASSGTAGHIMLYVGNDTFLHSTGSSFKLADGTDFAYGKFESNLNTEPENPVGSYDGATSTEKSVGSVQTLEADMIFDSANSDQKRYLFYTSKSDSTWSFSLIRPLADSSLVPTAEARVRIANPGLDIEKSAKSAHMSTVLTGEEITYTIRVSNKASDTALTDIEVKDLINESVTYIDGSINNNGIVDGNEVSWTIPTIAAGSSVSLSYTVKVNDNVKVGTKIDSSLGTVEGIATNKIWHVVGGISPEAANILEVELAESVGSSYSDTLAYVKDIYAGLDDSLLDSYTTVEEVLDATIDYDNDTVHTNTEASKMVVEDLWGGWFATSTLNRGAVTNYKTSYFESGDIIVVHNTYNNEGTSMYVYNSSSLITTVVDGKVVAAYEGSEVAKFLVTLYAYNQVAILRPSYVIESTSVTQEAVNSTVADLDNLATGSRVNTTAVVVGYVADNNTNTTAGLLLADETTKDMIIVQGFDGVIPNYTYTNSSEIISIGDKVELTNVVYYPSSPSVYVYSGSLTKDRAILALDGTSSVSYVSEGHSVTFEADTVVSDTASWKAALDDISMYQIIKFEASPDAILYVGQSYYPASASQAYFHYNGSAANLSETKYDIKVNGTSINSSGEANIGISKYNPLISVDNYFDFVATGNSKDNRPVRVNYSYGEIYGVVTHVTTTYVLVTPVNTITLDQGAKVQFALDGGEASVTSGTYKLNSTIVLPEATKADATFLGWSDGTTTYNIGDEYVVKGTVTFTALWTTESTYEITFVAEGADEVPTLPKQPAGIVTLPAKEPIRDGFAFAGWSDGVAVYQPGDEYELTGATTFTAVFIELSTVTDMYGEVEDKSTVNVEGIVIGYIQDTNAPTDFSERQIGLLIMDPVTEQKIAVQGFVNLDNGSEVTTTSANYYTTDLTPQKINVGDKISLVNVTYYAHSFYANTAEEGEESNQIAFISNTSSVGKNRKVLGINADSEVKIISSDNQITLTNKTTVKGTASLKSAFANISLYDVFVFEADANNILYVGQSSGTALDANGYLHYNGSATEIAHARISVKANGETTSESRAVAISKYDPNEPNFGFKNSASNRPTRVNYNSGSITVVVVQVTPTYVVFGVIENSCTLEKKATVSVTFESYGYEVDKLPTMNPQIPGTTITLPSALTHESLEFVGWSDGTTTYEAGSSYTVPTSAVTFTAVWNETAHLWSEVTYTWADDYSTCTAHRVCDFCKTVEEETATSAFEGQEYIQCVQDGAAVYTATFENPAFEQQVYEDASQPAHVLTHYEYIAPTAEAEGKLEHWICSDCSKVFLDEKATIEVALDVTDLYSISRLYDGEVVIESGSIISAEAVVIGHASDNNARAERFGLLAFDSSTQSMIIIHGLSGTYPEYVDSQDNVIKVGDKLLLTSIAYYPNTPTSDNTYIYNGYGVGRKMLLANNETIVTILSSDNDTTVASTKTVAATSGLKSALASLSYFDVLFFNPGASNNTNLYIGQSDANPESSNAWISFGSSGSIQYAVTTADGAFTDDAVYVSVTKNDPNVDYFGMEASAKTNKHRYSNNVQMYGVVVNITATYVCIAIVNDITGTFKTK